MLYTIFWRRFNTAGALWSIYGGLSSCVVLIIFSPLMSGSLTSIVHGVDFHWFPLENPGIVSIPLSFILGFLGTVFSDSPERLDEDADGGFAKTIAASARVRKPGIGTFRQQGGIAEHLVAP